MSKAYSESTKSCPRLGIQFHIKY